MNTYLPRKNVCEKYHIFYLSIRNQESSEGYIPLSEIPLSEIPL